MPDQAGRADDAERRFDQLLERLGEGVCLFSLPLLVDEEADRSAAGDPALQAEIAARLRRRAGLREA